MLLLTITNTNNMILLIPLALAAVCGLLNAATADINEVAAEALSSGGLRANNHDDAELVGGNAVWLTNGYTGAKVTGAFLAAGDAGAWLAADVPEPEEDVLRCLLCLSLGACYKYNLCFP